MKSLAMFAFALFLPASAALAGDHSLSSIHGTDIDLKVYDHAIAGSIRDFVVFGNKDEETGRSELIMKRDGQLVRATFGREGNKTGGTIAHDVEGVTTTTTLELAKIDMQRQEITVLVNGRPIVVEIRGESFVNNHFIKPSYRTVIDGKEVSFAFESGQACYGFSTHLIFMIIGAYVH